MATSIYRKQLEGFGRWCCRVETGHTSVRSALFCGAAGLGVVVRVLSDGTLRELNGKERKEARCHLGTGRDVAGNRLDAPYVD